MILEYSFTPKYQISTDTPEDFCNLLKEYAKDFEAISKIKNLEKVCDDPSNHCWHVETNDPNEIEKLIELGFQDVDEIYGVDNQDEEN